MPTVSIVENPKRRRRTRRLSRKQLSYGFGGKRRRTVRRRRRRNPALATLAANPRRRRRTTRRYYARPRRRTRRRNPALGGLGKMLNLNMAISVGTGIVAAHVAPGLLRKVWPGAPSTGLAGTAVRIGSVVLVATGVRMITRKNAFAAGIIAGGVGYELYRLADQYLLPTLGLYGPDDIQMTVPELEAIGVAGYQPTPNRLSGYQVTDEVLAA